MSISRRNLLKYSALTGAGVVTGSAFGGLSSLNRVSAAGLTSGSRALAAGGPSSSGGFGPLVADPNGILDLPAGFTYQILQRGGNNHTGDFTTYDDGVKVAGDADGTGSFAVGNGVVLVMNHELGPTEMDEAVPQTFGYSSVPTYDSLLAGGTSNIVLDAAGNVTSIYPSLAGTYSNCAGGVTPWGTWLTCEETESNGPSGMPHGYIFEVDPAGVKTDAKPYTAMGRFQHEAVAIDPGTSIAYMTQDNSRGLLYRFVPTDTSQQFGSLGNGGVVTAMKAAGLTRLGEVTTVGTTVSISWVPVPGGDADITGLAETFDDASVTRSTKLEGCWWGNGVLYFGSSYERVAGVEHHGQIWALDPAASTITLVAYIPVDDPTFDSPDNITVTPWGGLMLCEDGDDEQYIVGVDVATGECWAFGRNAMSSMNEFTGANFSPDGSTMFVNVQNPSTTFAITGPWDGAPDPEIPEVPLNVLLPLTAAAVGVGALALNNRRQTSDLDEAPAGI